MTAYFVIGGTVVLVAIWTELQMSLARRRDKYADLQPPE